jgi:hypothetical protein
LKCQGNKANFGSPPANSREPATPNKTPATKVEKVESEPRFGANTADHSGRWRLLSGASNKANFPDDTAGAGASDRGLERTAWAKAHPTGLPFALCLFFENLRKSAKSADNRFWLRPEAALGPPCLCGEDSWETKPICGGVSSLRCSVSSQQDPAPSLPGLPTSGFRLDRSHSRWTASRRLYKQSQFGERGRSPYFAVPTCRPRPCPSAEITPIVQNKANLAGQRPSGLSQAGAQGSLRETKPILPAARTRTQGAPPSQ